MELVHGDLVTNGPVAILPGAFDPPTIAHLGLAAAALARVQTVVFALPRDFPHKRYHGVPREARLAMLTRLAAPEPRFAVALTDGGLFVEMARELSRLCPSVRDVFLLCGRDAAERLVTWPYPETDPLERQLESYSLLVAARDGEFLPPAHLRPRVETLPAEAAWQDISSTLVRQRIQRGDLWRPLVPPPLHDIVAALYSPSRLDSKNVRNR